MKPTKISSQTIDIGPIEIATAHFVHTTKPTSKCQHLHGHNYIIDVHLQGTLAADDMLVDANDIKAIIDFLDHHTLVPRQLIIDKLSCLPMSSCIFKNPTTNHVYAIPLDDCRILNIEATTAESIARYFATGILKKFENLTLVQVTVRETQKLTATVEVQR